MEHSDDHHDHTVTEGRFRELVENIQKAAVMLDRNGTVVFVNCSFLEITGWTERSEVLGKNWFDHFLPEQTRDAMRSRYEQCMNGHLEPMAVQENYILTKSGSPLLTSWYITLSQNPAGDILGLNFLGEDISQRKSVEVNLKRAETIMKVFLDNSSEAIIKISDKGIIYSFNRMAERLFGYAAAEVMGQNVSKLMPQPHRGKHDDYIQTYLNTGVANIIGKGREVLGLRKNGTTFPMFLSVGRDLVIDGERFFLGFVRDLSREKQVAAQLRQSQKMEAIGTLAGGIAHDFNNILGGILGYTELMLEDCEDGSYLQEDLNEMLKACNRGKALVQQILTFSRQDKPSHEPVLLQPILKESLKLLRATIPTTIHINNHIQDKVRPVVADPTQLHQVVMNLCTNAYHAMRRGGGEMRIGLREVELDENYNEWDHQLPFGHYLQLTVSDTGHGMDDETASRVFEPFFTTKPLGQGTGMGLAVVHGIVRNHGGNILVRSVLGEGTTFCIFLPLVEDSIDHETQKETDSKAGSERIMLVDDDEFLLRAQARMLIRRGYEVTAFSHSEEAASAFRANPQDYDLVITDQTMPHLTGAELARHIFDIRPDMPIILTTGFSDVITEAEAKTLGIREFLMKPVEKEVMAHTIRGVLSGKKEGSD